MTTKTEALKLALEALEKIAFAGMAAPPEMSEDGRTKWHAQQAFNFMGIAAWAVDSVKEALAQPEQPAQEPVGQLQEEAYGRGQVLWFKNLADRSLLYASPPARKELLEALQNLMEWQVKNVKCWHNSAYDQAALVVAKATAEVI